MENASKALIIAGEVLIAVLVLSLMASIFLAFGNFSTNMHAKMSRVEIQQFNSHFYAFEGRENITAQEIVTIINFAKKANDSRELEYNTRKSSEYYTTVTIDGKDVFEHADFVNNQDKYDNKLPDILNEFMKNNNFNYFKCKSILVHEGTTGLVYRIDFQKENKMG